MTLRKICILLPLLVAYYSAFGQAQITLPQVEDTVELKQDYYPKHTLAVNLSYPVRSRLQALQGSTYRDRFVGSLSPFIGNGHQTFSLEVLGTLLNSRYYFRESGRGSLSYGFFYEKSPILYSPSITPEFPENTGYTYQKLGFQVGPGARIIERGIMGLDGEALIGLVSMREAPVALDNSDDPSTYNVGNYGEALTGFMWRARFKLDLGYVTIAFDFRREFALGEGLGTDRYQLNSNHITLGVPIHRVLKFK